WQASGGGRCRSSPSIRRTRRSSWSRPRGPCWARWCFAGAAMLRRNRDLPRVRSQGIIRRRKARPVHSPNGVLMARPVPPRRFLPGLLFLVAACSGRSPSPAAAPAPAAGPGTNGASLAHAMTVPALEGYELAVNRGTRSRSGAPGPRYWQQWADYKLEAELNPVSKRMTGKGTISYQNRSPDTLRTVYIQLLQNIFAPGARHNTGVPWAVEGIDLDRVAAQGATLAAGSGDAPGYDVNG